MSTVEQLHDRRKSVVRRSQDDEQSTNSTLDVDGRLASTQVPWIRAPAMDLLVVTNTGASSLDAQSTTTEYELLFH